MPNTRGRRRLPVTRTRGMRLGTKVAGGAMGVVLLTASNSPAAFAEESVSAEPVGPDIDALASAFTAALAAEPGNERKLIDEFVAAVTDRESTADRQERREEEREARDLERARDDAAEDAERLRAEQEWLAGLAVLAPEAAAIAAEAAAVAAEPVPGPSATDPLPQAALDAIALADALRGGPPAPPDPPPVEEPVEEG